MAPARRQLCMKHTMSQHINNLVEQPALVKMVRWSVIGRTSKMATGSWYFLSFSALTQQIRTAGLWTKAFRFVVWDRSVPSSEISNFRLLIMTSGTLAFSLLKLANPVAEELNSPFHTLGASGFSCAVSRCGQVLKSDPREKFFLAASPLVSSAFGRTLVGLWPTERSSPSHARRNL